MVPDLHEFSARHHRGEPVVDQRQQLRRVLGHREGDWVQAQVFAQLDELVLDADGADQRAERFAPIDGGVDFAAGQREQRGVVVVEIFAVHPVDFRQDARGDRAHGRAIDQARPVGHVAQPRPFRSAHEQREGEAFIGAREFHHRAAAFLGAQRRMQVRGPGGDRVQRLGRVVDHRVFDLEAAIGGDGFQHVDRIARRGLADDQERRKLVHDRAHDALVLRARGKPRHRGEKRRRQQQHGQAHCFRPSFSGRHLFIDRQG